MEFQVIAAPLELGCGTVGTSRAFEAMLPYLSTLPFSRDGHGYLIDQSVIVDNNVPRRRIDGMHNPDEVIAACRQLERQVFAAIDRGRFPLIIGGDHSVSMGSIAGVGRHFDAERLSVVWVDAHTDINTEGTSQSANIHGMPLAAMLDLCGSALSSLGYPGPKLLARNIHIIAARSIDPPEAEIIRRTGVNLYTIDCLREEGLEQTLQRMLDRLDTPAIHLSFDVDVMEPSVFDATGLPVPNGIYPDEAVQILTGVIRTGRVVSMDCVEYNPLLDDPERNGLATLLSMLSPALEDLTRFARIPYEQG